ncbi:hypothetical protein Tco_0611478 [Tanacetum coccineum]
MDSIIPIGQKNTLAEYMILSGADNRPPMLDKDLYDLLDIRKRLYMQMRARVAKDLWKRVQLLMQELPSNPMKPSHSSLDSAGDNETVRESRAKKFYSGTTYKGNATSSMGNTTSGQARVTEDLDTYDSDCDDLSTAQAVLMANISNYGSDIISEVPNSKTYLNDMDNQSVHALQDFEQSPVMDFTDNEISSDSNIILYSQYLQETQQATIQDTNLQAQQDSMILSVIEQMSE